MISMPLTRRQRVTGGLLGSLIGDALGVPVEFISRQKRDADPVANMRAFGTHNQPAGTWSDDGALLLCTAESLLDKPNEEQAGQLYLRWLREGYNAVGGRVFDVGGATRAALARIAQGVPAATAGGIGENDNGNGSLMRILPVALRFAEESPDVVISFAMRWSAITHRHPRSQLACACYCLIAQQLMHGATPGVAYREARGAFGPVLARFPQEQQSFARFLSGELAQLGRDHVKSGGYVIDTLDASIWCLLQGGSFGDMVLRAVNLGDDTDTTGCVTGGLAGVLLGVDAIQADWKSALAKDPPLGDLIERFVCVSGG